MPLLWGRFPELQLYLAGGFSEKINELNNDRRVIVTGYRDSLVPYIKEAMIFVSPIFFGAGVKTKILEAMYLEKIVVGSEQSFNAIECNDRKDCIMIYDEQDPLIWSDEITKILNDFNSFIYLGCNAKKTILKYHNWENIRKIYYNEYNKFLLNDENHL